MRNYVFLLTLSGFLFFSCKTKTSESTDSDKADKKGTPMACTGESAETPRGEEINRFKDRYEEEHVMLFSLEQDTCYLIETVLSKELQGEYLLVDISAFAYKDINPSADEGVFTSEYDIDLTDGGKEHQTVFFIKSKNDERIFKQRTYTCLDGEGNHFSLNDLSGANISCSSIEKAKEMVEQIKGKLPK